MPSRSTHELRFCDKLSREHGGQNREGVERSVARPLAQGSGGDRAAQLRLRNFTLAGDSQARASVSHGPRTIAARRGNKKQIVKEKLFQHLNCADMGHEGAESNQKGSETRG